MEIFFLRGYHYKFLKIFTLICFCLITLSLFNHKSSQEKELTKQIVNSIPEDNLSDPKLESAKNEMKNNNSLNCEPENQTGNVDPKEFFIFKSGIIWCNVFKSASTSVLYMLGLLDGISKKRLKSMDPLVSEMRNIYGRPTLEQILEVSKSQENIVFIVKRNPFKRLFSGFKDKILQSRKTSYYGQISEKILEKYRNSQKRKSRKYIEDKDDVPTFSEFIEYVLDNYEENNEIDMHWAPVVNFCSVCNIQYTHVLDFENLSDEFERMKSSKKILQDRKLNKIRENANSKNPRSSNYIQKNLQSLTPEIYERLQNLYEKDFKVFGYKLPSFEEINSGDIF